MVGCDICCDARERGDDINFGVTQVFSQTSRGVFFSQEMF